MMEHTHQRISLLLIHVLLACSATIIYVSVDGDDVPRCGRNATNPCRTIQHAVKIANPGGTLVLLQPTGTRTRSFIVSQQIQLSKSVLIVGEIGKENVIIQTVSSTSVEEEVASQATSSNGRSPGSTNDISHDIIPHQSHRSPGSTGNEAPKVKSTADQYSLRWKLRRNPKSKLVNRSLEQLGDKKTSDGSSDATSFHLFQPIRPNLSVSARFITFRTIGFLEADSPVNVSLIDCRLEGGNVNGVVLYQGEGSRIHDSCELRLSNTIVSSSTGGGLNVNDCRVRIDNSTFINNPSYAIKSKGSIVYLIDCNFLSNRASGPVVDLQCTLNGTCVHIEGCLFRNNTGVGKYIRGGGIQIETLNLHALKPIHSSVLITNSTFDGNSVANGYGGAAYFSSRPNTELTVILSSNTFSNNSGYSGGAICISDHAGQSGRNKMRMVVSDSLFIYNHAEYWGGAIYANSDVTIRQSKFHKNRAIEGGAVSLKVPNHILTKLKLEHSIFKQNFAYSTGGALLGFGFVLMTVNFCTFEENDIPSKSFLGASAISSVLSSLSLTNSLVTSGKLVSDGMQIYAAGHGTEIKNTSIASGNPEHRLQYSVLAVVGVEVAIMNVTCPSGTLITNTSSKVPGEPPTLSVYCNPCSNGLYSLKSAQLRVNSKIQVFESNLTACMDCAVGGVCMNGNITSLPGYWGFVGDVGAVEFVHCLDGYCADKPDDFQSCHEYRQGTLCGECKQGYTLSTISNQCVSNENCKPNVGGFCAVFLLTSLCCTAFLVFLKDIVNCAGKCFSKCKPSRNGTPPPSSTPVFQGATQQMINFYQIQKLLQAPVPVSFSSLQTFLHIFSAIFNINFLDSSYSGLEFCPLPGLNATQKEWLKVLFVVALFLWIAVLFAAIQAVNYFTSGRMDLESLRLKAKKCCVQMCLLVFIPLTTSLFRLVNCIDVYEDGLQQVLFIQGTYQCAQWWRPIVIVIIVLWSVCFVQAVYIGSALYKSKKITDLQLMVSLCFPFLSLYFAGRLIYQRVTKRCMLTAMDNPYQALDHSSSAVSGTVDVEAVDVNPLSTHTVDVEAEDPEDIVQADPAHIQSVSIGWDDENSLNSDNGSSTLVHGAGTMEQEPDGVCDDTVERRNAADGSASSTSSLVADDVTAVADEGGIDITAQPFVEGTAWSLRRNWQAVLITRKLLLVATFIFVHDTIIRLYCLVLIIMLAQVHHLYNLPYKSSVLNHLETALLTLLILLGTINNFWAGQYNGIPASKRGTADGLLIGQTVALMLPLPILCCLLAFNRKMTQHTGQKPKQRTSQKPKQRTGQKPKQRTGQKPKQRTGQKLKQRTGQKLKQRTGQKPKQRTGQKPKQRPGQKPKQV